MGILNGYEFKVIAGLISLGLLMIFLALMSSCSPTPVERFNDWVGWNDDSLGEEALEYMLEKETGIDIDFSPRSAE